VIDVVVPGEGGEDQQGQAWSVPAATILPTQRRGEGGGAQSGAGQRVPGSRGVAARVVSEGLWTPL